MLKKLTQNLLKKNTFSIKCEKVFFVYFVASFLSYERKEFKWGIFIYSNLVFMKKRFLLLVILLIFVISSVTFILILNYFDPYSAPVLALSMLVITFVLSISGFLSLVLYVIKKIHYRWDVNMYHVKTSFRQAIFFSLFIIWAIIFKIFSAPVVISSVALWVLFLFLELFIQNLN